MRWLFVGVVVLNLLYFGWRLASPDDVVVPAASVVDEPAFPASLSLLAEGSAAGVARVAPVPAVTGCPAIGPWSSAAEGDQVAKALAGAGIKAGARSVEFKGLAVYWVYLPPFAEHGQAMRKLRELQAKGIDSFIVSGGADANAISLGSFTSRGSAVGVQSRLRGAGYAADIREQHRDVQQVWVVMQDPSAQGYLEHVPADLQARARQERLPCN